MRSRLLAGLFLGVCACGTTTANPGSDRDSGALPDAAPPSGPTDPTPNPDSGAPRDASDDGDGGPVRTAKSGTIFVSQPKGNNGWATAAFSSYGAACTTSAIGACSIRTCDLTPGAADAGAVTFANAGTITVTTASPWSATLSLMPAADGAYPIQFANGGIWAPGIVVTAQASGADVPAFAGKTVSAPQDLVRTKPTSGGTTAIALSRATDLLVEWTAGTEGDAVVGVETNQAGVRSVAITCSAPAATGTLTVPGAMLHQLDKANQAAIEGKIQLVARNQTVFTAGDWEIALSANVPGSIDSFVCTD